jgi:2-polyprenyl-6-methoxyphenol hydroxylase-like FAD-dependent oxidoreductase
MVLDGTVDKVVEMDCMDTDIVIVGGGLTGLCMARALHGTGLQIRIVEMAESKMLAEPADDGREIALTHPSRAQLESLGVWEGIDPDTVSELRDAWVFDGESRLPGQ